MKTIAFVASAILALAVNETAVAQKPPQPCPHTTVKQQAADAQPVGQQTCGAGVHGTFGQFRIGLNQVACPMFVVLTPPRDVPMHQDNCNTYTEVAGSVAVELLPFRCVTHYILFVPLYDTCDPGDPRVMANLLNYAVQPCSSAAPRDATE